MYKKIILFIGLFLLLGKLCHMATKRIFYTQRYKPQALIKKESMEDSPSTPPAISLNQTFTFLGMGNS